MTYCIAVLLVIPYIWRRRYLKYSNVHQSEKFHPILNDVKHVMDDIKAGRSKAAHWARDAAKGRKDIKFIILGNIRYFFPVSPQAVKEFIDLIPRKIDRCLNLELHIGKLIPSGFALRRSDTAWKTRRDFYVKHMGINFASQHIPTMFSNIREDADKYVGTGKDFNFAIGTFNIAIQLLFGRDVTEAIGTMEYDNLDGTQTKMTPGVLFAHISADVMDAYTHPVGMLFSFVNRYSLMAPYTRNWRNIRRFRESMTAYLKGSKGEGSIYGIMREQGYDDAQIYSDLAACLIGGSETSAVVVFWCLFLLKKNPECLEKLIKILTDGGFEKMEDMPINEFKELIEDWDYLSFVVKEALRMDAPLSCSLGYETLEDVEICGVPIPKGENLDFHIKTVNYDPETWYEVESFIPERFDPNHKYFNTPESGGKKPRNPYQFIPFSAGTRYCPGMAFASLEMKVILAFFLMNYEYEIEQELLDQEGAFFHLFSQMEPRMKISKRQK